jgi:hypothetical protein
VVASLGVDGCGRVGRYNCYDCYDCYDCLWVLAALLRLLWVCICAYDAVVVLGSVVVGFGCASRNGPLHMMICSH